MSGPSEGAIRLGAAESLRPGSPWHAVAFRASEWEGKDTLQFADGRTVPVFFSNSDLAIRDRLNRATPEEPVVILTELSDSQLGKDLLAQLAHQRVRQLSVWDPVLAAFGARSIAPRLRKAQSLPEALQRLEPAAGYLKAPNGVLTESHAWDQLIRVVLGTVPETSLDLTRALLDPVVANRLAQDSPEQLSELVAPISDRLEQLTGPAAAPMLACVSRRHSKILVPAGLVARVAYSSSQANLMAARGQMKSWYGSVMADETGIAVADAAEAAFRESSADERSAWQRQAEELLNELGIVEEAWRSERIRLGFEQRLERLSSLLRDGSSDLAEVKEALQMAEKHTLAEPGRVRAARMAVRLRLFLDEERVEAESFVEAARFHVNEGGWVDLAREALDKDDPNPGVDDAYRVLAENADIIRAQTSKRFAHLLAKSTAAGSLGGCIGVESALEERVVPLAAGHPVLVILLDGLSEAAFRSIRSSIGEENWTDIGPGDVERTPMVAALPSVTNYSRVSLLSGSLQTGAQKAERDGFEGKLTNFGEVKLFHKADLAKVDEIVNAISREQTRVVGVVVNAIDDLLDKGDLAHFQWTLESIKPLQSMLSAAYDAGRVVVIAGDHGHVLERSSELRSDDSGGSRWRLPGLDPPQADEVLVEGPRVLVAGGKAVLAANEGVRYTGKRAGYHGGATPQEVITPLATLAPSGVRIEGWGPCAENEPAWWLIEKPIAAEHPSASVRPATPDRVGHGQTTIFDSSSEETELETRSAWIDELIGSEAFAASRARLTRVPSEAQIVGVLAVLDRGQGVAGESVVAQALGIPKMRVSQVVASIRPLLNLEGFQVLEHDRSTGEIRLDRELLKKQFAL